MRLVLLLLAGCLALSSSAQYLAVGVDVHTPLTDQKGKLKNAYGFNAGYEHRFRHTPLYALLDLSGSVYDYKIVNQELPGPTGHITEQRVEYTSSVSVFSAGIGVAPWHRERVSPYVALKGGYMKYRTSMNLYDADDPDGCKPTEKKNILRDFTAVAVASSGVKIRVEPKKGRPYHLDVGANYLSGGTSKYLRMRKTHDPAAPESDPYLVKFQQVQSGEVHAHPLGDVFTTNTRQLQFYVKAIVLLKE